MYFRASHDSLLHIPIEIMGLDGRSETDCLTPFTQRLTTLVNDDPFRGMNRRDVHVSKLRDNRSRHGLYFPRELVLLPTVPMYSSVRACVSRAMYSSTFEARASNPRDLDWRAEYRSKASRPA